MDDLLAPSRLPRVTLHGVLLFVVAHAFIATTYAATVTLDDPIPLQGVLARSLLDHGLKALLTLPVWFVIIRALDGKPWQWRLPAHCLVMPIYVWTWYWAYHWSVDALGAVPIYPASDKWNVFLAIVIYAAQFSIMHLVREQALVRRHEKLAAQLRDLATQAELRALRGQVPTHFLFNTLHSLSSSIPRELEGVRSRIARLGNLLRYTLSTSRRDLVTLHEELALIQDYLALEKARLGDRIEVSFDIDEKALAAAVPPVLLQPIVENALKHGVGASPLGGRIDMSIQRCNGSAVIIVRDQTSGDRPSTTPSPGAGVGLRNCATRLRGALGAAANLRTRVLPTGFEVEIVVPLETAAS